jgi:hypothetical protein
MSTGSKVLCFLLFQGVAIGLAFFFYQSLVKPEVGILLTSVPDSLRISNAA